MSTEAEGARVQDESAAEVAGELFDRGSSCIQSVLQATCTSAGQEVLAATAGFSCGIGKSGCLCGAVTGGVMALGIKGCGHRSAELLSAFKAAFKTSCCRGLSETFVWMSEDHQTNCRKITVTTAGMVEALL